MWIVDQLQSQLQRDLNGIPGFDPATTWASSWWWMWSGIQSESSDDDPGGGDRGGGDDLTSRSDSTNPPKSGMHIRIFHDPLGLVSRWWWWWSLVLVQLPPPPVC